MNEKSESRIEKLDHKVKPVRKIGKGKENTGKTRPSKVILIRMDKVFWENHSVREKLYSCFPENCGSFNQVVLKFLPVLLLDYP